MAELLNIDSALEMLGGDRELLAELLSGYLNDRIFDGDELNRLIELQDENGCRTEAAKYVHYFKGAARQLGAEILAESGQELEDVLRGKKTGDIPLLAKAFSDDYASAVSEMKKHL